MARQIPNPGTYQGKITPGTKMVVYEAGTGALCVAMSVMLVGSDVAWSGRHTHTIVKSDGTLLTRRIDELKAIFGWDGLNPFELEDLTLEQLDAAMFEIVGEHELYTPTDGGEPRDVFKIQFLNPPGGAGAPMPEAIDRKQALAKWGSKFKAHSGATGGTVKAPAAAAKTATAPVGNPTPSSGATSKSKSAGPPSRKATGATARTSTQEECWTAYKTANAGKGDDELGDAFYAAQDEVSPDANGELTIQQWGEVANKLGV